MDVNFDHLAEVVFVDFLQWKVTLFPLFPYCSIWIKVTQLSLHLRSGESCSISLM